MQCACLYAVLFNTWQKLINLLQVFSTPCAMSNDVYCRKDKTTRYNNGVHAQGVFIYETVE